MQVAKLLYEGDKPFVPVTPLSVLRDSTTFFRADIEGAADVRAASSYDAWLQGSDEEGGAAVGVYELASSIVRDPMGGFKNPSLQQIFAFVRLVDILYPFVSANDAATVSVIACIAAGNQPSLAGMQGLGMQLVDPLPKWLEYEHRSWFPRLVDDRPRQVSDEAHYLWLPPQQAEALFRGVAPYADGTASLSRPSRQVPGQTEDYRIAIEFTGYSDIVESFGSFTEALPHIPFHILGKPPQLARLNGGFF